MKVAIRNGLTLVLAVAVAAFFILPFLVDSASAEETFTAKFTLSPYDGWLEYLPATYVTDNEITFSAGEVKYFPSAVWDPSRIEMRNVILVFWRSSGGETYRAHDVIPEKNEEYTPMLNEWPCDYYELRVSPGENCKGGIEYVITGWDGNFAIPEPPPDYIPEDGYLFSGWKVKETGEIFGLERIGEDLSPFDYDGKTVEAIWQRKRDSYTVTFDLAGMEGRGSLFPDSSTDTADVNFKTVRLGGQARFPSFRTDSDSVLLRWEDSLGNEYLPGGYTPEISDDVTYTARFGSAPPFSELRVTPGEGEGYAFYISTAGPSFSAPACPEDFSCEGRVFDGWELTESPGGEPEGRFSKGDEIPAEGHHRWCLTARWIDPNRDRVLTYHFNGPESDISAASHASYSDGFEITVKDINDALREAPAFAEGDRVTGRVFAGWSPSQEGPADPAYEVGSKFTLKEDLDLYAVWEEGYFAYTLRRHHVDVDGEDHITEESPGEAQIDFPIPYDTDDSEYGGSVYLFNHERAPAERPVTSAPAENVLDLYYDADTLNDEMDCVHEADGIADKFQRVINFKVVNGGWNSPSRIRTLARAPEKSGEATVTQVVTLMKDGVPSENGTATVDPPIGTVESDEFYGRGRWNTPGGRAPITVSGSTGPEVDFTLTFLRPENTIILRPSSSDTVVYDGNMHTFDFLNVLTVSGEPWIGAAVEIRDDTLWRFSEALAGTYTVDLNAELDIDWDEFLNIRIGGTPIRKDTWNVFFDPGTLEIAPRPLDVTITVPEESERTFTYCSDPYTVDAKEIVLGGIVGDDEVKLLTETGKPLSVTATHVKKDAMGRIAVSNALELDKEHLSLDGEDAGNYSIGSVTVIGDARDRLSVTITPRAANYYTFGGAWVYNTIAPTLSGPLAGGFLPATEPWFESLDPATARTDGLATGFILRGDAPERDNSPVSFGAELRSDAGIYPYRVTFSAFSDTGGPYPQEAGYDPGRQHFDDYDVTYHWGYLRIFPQSIDPENDMQGDDASFTAEDVYRWDNEEIRRLIADYDANNDGGVTYDELEDGALRKEYLRDYYMGVTVSDPPAMVYGGDGKWVPEVIDPRYSGDGSKAASPMVMVEGRDYEVSYKRESWGEWIETDDFTTPGEIQVTVTGLAPNYCDSVTRTYTVARSSQGLLEINDHEHYAYMIGKPGGLIDPEGKITRAEIATIIFRLLKEDVREEYWSKTNSFPDVEITDWYNNAISTLENLGIVEGKGDGLYHPEDPITRAEMATMMARLYDYDVNTGDFHTKFDDIDPDAWYARYVAAAEDLGLFVGDGATDHFYPERSLSRAEAMTVYNRLLGRKPHNDGLLPEEQMILWPDNMDTAAWYYADVQEATNSHTCDMDGTAPESQPHELWLMRLPTPDWSATERTWSKAYSG